VLDEVTSALDWESDRIIVEALRERRAAGRSTLIVTHRLHLAASADEVVVLDRGRVTQRGTHEALIEVEGLYQRLWKLQTGGPAA
jgi:ABC-type multidrug transport system fused ATPase/permease subunit